MTPQTDLTGLRLVLKCAERSCIDDNTDAALDYVREALRHVAALAGAETPQGIDQPLYTTKELVEAVQHGIRSARWQWVCPHCERQSAPPPAAAAPPVAGTWCPRCCQPMSSHEAVCPRDRKPPVAAPATSGETDKENAALREVLASYLAASCEKDYLSADQRARRVLAAPPAAGASPDLVALVNDVLACAWQLDNKPHLLFSSLRRLAVAMPNDATDTTVRLLDEARDRAHLLLSPAPAPEGRFGHAPVAAPAVEVTSDADYWMDQRHAAYAPPLAPGSAPAAPAVEGRRVSACAAHSVLACVVCLTDECARGRPLS